MSTNENFIGILRKEIKTDPTVLTEMDFQNISNDKSEATLPCQIKKTRSKISSIDKIRIVNSYENGEDMNTVARLLNINYGSLKNVLYRFNKNGSISTGKIGGYRKKVLNDEIGDVLLAQIDKNPCMTLREMKIFLEQNSYVASATTISKYLRNRFYTFKKLRYSTVEKNTDKVKELRRDYVTNHLKNSIRSKQCIYIDETYCNLWTQKFKGRAPRGKSAFLQVPSRKGANVAILMAIGKSGPIYFEVHQGSVTQPMYQKFLLEVSLRLKPKIHYLIHDNASIHNDVLTTAEHHKILKLPPYSPFLNPIENYFSKIKSMLRKKLTDFNFNGNILSQYQIIRKSIEEIMTTEKDVNLKEYFHHIKIYYPDCLCMENIY